MGKLITLFRQKNNIFLQRRHENTSSWQMTKSHRIEKFLRYCETKRVNDIHQIKQKCFDNFMKLLSENKSNETMRQYAIAIKEFATRAHLDIKINPENAKRRRITKKTSKIIFLIEQKLDIKIPDDLAEEISKIL